MGVSGSQKVLNIFLVDDDIDDREFFASALGSLDPSALLTTFQNGKEFVDYLKSGSTVLPDVVFMDINMPIMNGLQSLEHIRNDPRFLSVPIIAIYTTSVAAEDQNSSFIKGADAFITKPASFKEIVGIIRKVLTLDWSANREKRVPMVITA